MASEQPDPDAELLDTITLCRTFGTSRPEQRITEYLRELRTCRLANAELVKERDRIRLEIVAGLTGAGIYMLAGPDDPTGPGEITGAIRRLAWERDSLRADIARVVEACGVRVEQDNAYYPATNLILDAARNLAAKYPNNTKEVDRKRTSIDMLCDDCRELAALRAENEKLREERRWIPMSERLPDDEVRVLVQDPRGHIDLARMRFGKMFYNYNWHCDVPFNEMSYWMPAPAPDTATGAAKGVEGAE
jgi:hypothetical protein